MTTNAVWTIPLGRLFLFLGVQCGVPGIPERSRAAAANVAQECQRKGRKKSLAATYGSTWRNYAPAAMPWIVTDWWRWRCFRRTATDAKRDLRPVPTRYVMVLRRFSAAGIAWTDGRGHFRGVHVPRSARSSIGELRTW